MAGYSDMVGRTDVQALIPEDVSAAIITSIAAANPLLQMARKLPNMSRSQRRIPVASTLASAYFVAGDTGLKQTTNLGVWANKFIDAEELAVIVPIPDIVVEDSGYDIWGESRPAIENAMNKAIIQAVLYGTNIPASWATNMGGAGLVAIATAAGHLVSAANYTDLYEAILGETAAVPPVPGLFGFVEQDGYAITGNLAAITLKTKLRNLRTADGVPIFSTQMQDKTRYELDGSPIYFPVDGSMDPAKSLMVSGDYNQLVYAIRTDITYKVFTEGVISDAAGNIVFNLMQQDMVALRAVMRLGFALPNPINEMNTNPATRCAFAVLVA